MKHVSKLAFVLMMLAMMAVIVPSAFASFVPVQNQSDPCTGILPCEPPPPPTCTPGVDCAGDPCEIVCPPPPPTCTPGVDCAGDPCEIVCPPPPTDPCTGVAMSACETPVPVTNPPAPAQGEQDTVSFNDSDLGVTLFVTHDENGAPVLQLYETQNQTTNGNFAVTITQDDLAPYVDNLPAANVLLKSAGHIRVFVLTTGEIAVFVGPDSEGKMHIKIFDGIPWTHVTSLTIDPA